VLAVSTIDVGKAIVGFDVTMIQFDAANQLQRKESFDSVSSVRHDRGVQILQRLIPIDPKIWSRKSSIAHIERDDLTAQLFIARTTKFTGRPRTIYNSKPTSTAAPVERIVMFRRIGF
jgi:hypothetical protein